MCLCAKWYWFTVANGFVKLLKIFSLNNSSWIIQHCERLEGTAHTVQMQSINKIKENSILLEIFRAFDNMNQFSWQTLYEQQVVHTYQFRKWWYSALCHCVALDVITRITRLSICTFISKWNHSTTDISTSSDISDNERLQSYSIYRKCKFTDNKWLVPCILSQQHIGTVR